MKVGIVTFHFPHNYGAMIQAYAMQQKLKELGHDAYIIDYAPEYHTYWFRRNITWRSCLIPSPRPFYRAVKNKLLHSKAATERYDNFQQFYKTKFSLYPYSKEDDLSSFDAVLLGSDQIWNIELTNHQFDSPYYGEEFRCRVFSYAASAMYKQLSDEQSKAFTRLLSPMAGVGVRELQLKELLQSCCDKEIEINLDPTLLAGASVYTDLNLDRPITEKYVLVYELQPHKDVQEMSKNYANAHGYKYVFLTGNIFYNTHKNFDLTASPEKFLAYIKNAECVFTTSFHGAALSLVFNTQFFSVRQNNEKDDRSYSILSQLGLLGQFVEMDDRPVDSNIDYDKVNEAFVNLRKSSLNYLMNMLK